MKGSKTIKRGVVYRSLLAGILMLPLTCTPTGGVAVITPDSPVTAGSYGTWTIRYTAGPNGVQPGGGIMIGFHHNTPWGTAQVSNSSAPNYVTASTTGLSLMELSIDYYSLNPPVEGRALAGARQIRVKVNGEALVEGDTIDVVLGDRSSGSPGYQVPGIARDATEVIVIEDMDGDGFFSRVSTTPTLDIVSGSAARLAAIAQSVNILGQPVLLVLRVEDSYYNPVKDYSGSIDLRDDETGNVLGSVLMSSEDEGVKRVEGIVFDSEGLKRVRAEDVGNGLIVVSNPILCSSAPQERVFWGEIHGHTILSDGLGTIAEFFDYARNNRNLDFAAAADHIGFDDVQQWEALNEGVVSAYDPGLFTTFLGFENSSFEFGHKNVLFRDEGEPIMSYRFTTEGLYEELQGRQAMVISHLHTGIWGLASVDWNLFDPNFERLVEIASYHGIREYPGNPYRDCDIYAVRKGVAQQGNTVQDALNRGYRLGFVANSDDHQGHPGGDHNGILPCKIPGLTAVLTAANTRADIWESLYQRRTYASTGARILLTFTLNGHDMGSELSPVEKRDIYVDAHGTATIAYIDIIKNGNLLHRHTGTEMDESLNILDTPSEATTDYYYARVIQDDGEIAWASPIWVGPQIPSPQVIH